MAEKVGDAFIDLSVRDDKLNNGLDRSENKVVKKSSKIGLAAGVAFAAAMAKGMSSAFSKFAADERSIARMNAVLKSTGYAAGLSSRELQDFASEFQSLTGIGDEVLRKTQAILLTFKNIKGEEFEQATILAADMAEVLDQDAKQGAIQLGKALNDPIKGITALSRVGVSFTQAQKDMIKAAQESGDMLGAQAVILKELKEEFGGAAAAAGDTFGGSMDKVSASLGDVGEGIGGLIVEFFNLKKANEDVADVFTRWAKGLKDLADSPELIAFSENVRVMVEKAMLEFKLFADNIELIGQVIGRSIKNMFSDNNLSGADLISQKVKRDQQQRDQFDEVFRTRLADRLKANTDQKIEEQKKESDAAKEGAADVVAAEAKKQKAREGSFSSFSDILRKAQESALLVPGMAGNPNGAIPPGTGGGSAITAATSGNQAVMKQMLAQLKLIVQGIEKMAVFA